MKIIYFVIGYILGIGTVYLALILQKVSDKAEEIAEDTTNSSETGQVKFIDPITPEQKFKEAEYIDDILRK